MMGKLTSFLSEKELSALGLKCYGDHVLISRNAKFYGTANISIGNNVRIDDFCILSASNNITIGNYVHIGCYTSIVGSGDVLISDYCSISGRVSIYSSSDDYSGCYMTNPMIPNELTNVTHGDIYLGKHVIIGCGCVILPNIRIEEGVAIGAMSFVNNSCNAYFIYSGNPLKRIIPRSKNIIELEKQLIIKKHGR